MLNFLIRLFILAAISCNALACKENDSDCLTEPAGYKCGTLLDLSTYDPEDPSTPGFNSGTYLGGSTVYPGIGVFPMCGNSDRAARISAGDNIKGAHTPCSINPGIEIFASKEAKYFVATPGLEWTQTNFHDLRSVEGAIKVNNYFVLRSNFTVNNETYQTIGLHHTDWSSCPVYYWNGEETIAIEDGLTEILTCV